MIEIRPARMEEIPRQKEVWSNCFGDGDAFIDYFYQNFFVQEEMVVLLDDGILDSMAALLPIELCLPDRETVKTRYLYALATDPKAQKKGFARYILRYADFYLMEQGAKCITLVPASPTLHRFFEMSQYQECFATRKVELRRTQLEPEVEGDTIVPVESAEYNRIREQQLAGRFYVRYDEKLIDLQRGICHMSGGDLYRITVDGVEGCAAVEYYEKDRVLVKELLIPPAQMGRAAAQIAKATPAGHYHLRTPGFWTGLQGSYIQAFGMIKWYDEEGRRTWFQEREGYLGLGFD